MHFAANKQALDLAGRVYNRTNMVVSFSHFHKSPGPRMEGEDLPIASAEFKPAKMQSKSPIKLDAFVKPQLRSRIDFRKRRGLRKAKNPIRMLLLKGGSFVLE